MKIMEWIRGQEEDLKKLREQAPKDVEEGNYGRAIVLYRRLLKCGVSLKGEEYLRYGKACENAGYYKEMLAAYQMAAKTVANGSFALARCYAENTLIPANYTKARQYLEKTKSALSCMYHDGKLDESLSSFDAELEKLDTHERYLWINASFFEPILKKRTQVEKTKNGKAIAGFAVFVFMLLGSVFLTLITLPKQRTESEGNTYVDCSDEVEGSVPLTSNAMRNYRVIMDDIEPVFEECIDIVDVTASSTLTTSSGFVYDAKYMADHNLDTSWQEGDDGHGIGCEVIFHLDPNTPIHKLVIWPGKQATEKEFRANSRPKHVTVRFDLGNDAGGELRPAYITLKDERIGCTIQFDEPQALETVTIRINSVYEGDRYSDLNISEVSFY